MALSNKVSLLCACPSHLQERQERLADARRVSVQQHRVAQEMRQQQSQMEADLAAAQQQKAAAEAEKQQEAPRLAAELGQLQEEMEQRKRAQA
jgi:hypothetical protein